MANAKAFSEHRIFREYYEDAHPATSVAEVEAYAKQFMDTHFKLYENVQEDYPDEYLMYQIVTMTDPAALTEALAHSNSWVRDLACKRYVFLTTDWDYKTWYIDVWNYTYCDNGESHGIIMGMCCKSASLELQKLGNRIWDRLKQIQGGAWVTFDT